MKRTDITELFPEATKEQIDKLMAINGQDINAMKSDIEALQHQIAGFKEKPNSDELTKAQSQIEQLTKELAGMKSAEAVRLVREKVATEKKVPAHLLSGDTEEACAKQADDILAFAQPKYPAVPDRGEIGNPPSTATREKFAAWAKDNI